jgi:hypothetical protein
MDAAATVRGGRGIRSPHPCPSSVPDELRSHDAADETEDQQNLDDRERLIARDLA